MAGLATRCPACDTVFRVVPDQLRVSDGWVRCGRCAHVFDAKLSLVDLETGAPQRAPEALPPQPEAMEPTARPLAAPQHESPQPEAEPTELGASAADFALDVEPAPVADAAAAASASSASAAVAAGGAEPVAQDIDPRAEPGDRPSFVREAERAERWQRPRVRAALYVMALLGVVSLAAQATYEYRAQLASRHALVRPALERACALLGCRIEAVRAIDKLSVENSGLVRIEKSNVYKLSVTLRNRDDIELAMPALDLALTDTQGKLLARRVLRAPELGASQAALGAGRDLALQATLQSATDPVAGYSVELFYP